MQARVIILNIISTLMIFFILIVGNIVYTLTSRCVACTYAQYDITCADYVQCSAVYTCYSTMQPVVIIMLLLADFDCLF